MNFTGSVAEWWTARFFRPASRKGRVYVGSNPTAASTLQDAAPLKIEVEPAVRRRLVCYPRLAFSFMKTEN
jgi:hypothetical protein